MKISQWIASIGQNIQFVAFWAHAGVGALVIRMLYKYHPSWSFYPAIVLVLGGAIKEYVFDAKEETNPPQTFWDNTEDFIGWLAGAGIGWWLR